VGPYKSELVEKSRHPKYLLDNLSLLRQVEHFFFKLRNGMIEMNVISSEIIQNSKLEKSEPRSGREIGDGFTATFRNEPDVSRGSGKCIS
jgi:hypothetical protein